MSEQVSSSEGQSGAAGSGHNNTSHQRVIKQVSLWHFCQSKTLKPVLKLVPKYLSLFCASSPILLDIKNKIQLMGLSVVKSREWLVSPEGESEVGFDEETTEYAVKKLALHS